MFLYQLNSKASDNAFLAREIVKCPATLPLDEMLSLEPDLQIVVQLSNKSKYKAVIKSVRFPVVQKGIAQGIIEIIRA